MDNICVKLQKNVQRYVDIEYRFILSKKKDKILISILFRTKLPVPMFDRSQISIWSILKQCIGKVNHSMLD